MIASNIILGLIHNIEKIINFHDFVTIAIQLLSLISLGYFQTLNIIMNKGIEGVSNKIDGLTGTTEEKMLQFNEIMTGEKNKVLKNLWLKYYSTLLEYANDDTEIEFTTFFNRHTLVDIPAKRKIAEIFPGIMIASGILGTFTGLILGLNQFDVSGAEAIQKSMLPLMEGLKIGFLASVIAIGNSLMWTFLDRIFLHRILHTVNKFQVAFERKFPPDSFSSHLIEMISLQNAQAAAVEAMKTEASQNQSGNNSGMDLSEMNSSLSDVFKPLVENMEKMRENMLLAEKNSDAKPQKEEVIEQGFSEEIVAQFDATLQAFVTSNDAHNRYIGMIIEELISSLKEEINLKKDTSTNLDVITKNMEVVSQQMNESISRTMTDTLNIATNAIEGSLNQFGSKLQTGIKQTLDTGINDLSASIDGKVEDLRNVVDLVDTTTGQIKKSVDQVTKRMLEKDALDIIKKIDDDF